MPSKKQNGFSLIELMVVIAIIGLLVSLVLPSYAALKIRSARAEMLQNVNFINTALQSFHAENDRYGKAGTENHILDLAGCTVSNGGAEQCYPETEGGKLIGFKYAADSVQKLNYFYTYTFTPTTFKILAYANRSPSNMIVGPSGPVSISFSGRGRPPISLHWCKKVSVPPLGNFEYYNDSWERNENGELKPINNSTDALQQGCLKS